MNTTNFKLDDATRDGLSRIALARGLTVDRSAFKGEPNRSAALRQIVAEELARIVRGISFPHPPLS